MKLRPSKPYTIHNGYIIYTRGEKNSHPIWRQVYKNAVAEGKSINSIFDSNQKGRDAGDKLLQLGENEFQKECALLAKAGVTINSETDVKTFIDQFNKILQGKKNYEDALKRIQIALSEERQNRNSRAPTIASFFTGYLNTALNERITKFLGGLNSGTRQALMNGDDSRWQQEFDTIINESIKSAFEKMLTKIGESGREVDDMYGSSEVWKAYYAASRMLGQGFTNNFIDMVKSKIDFDSIKDIFQRESKNGEKKIKLTVEKNMGISTLLGSKAGLNLKSGYKARSVGGSVDEFLQQLADAMGRAAQSAVSYGSAVFKNETMVTDNVAIFSYNREVDIGNMSSKLAKQINDAMDGTKNLQQAAAKMEQFYKDNLSKLKDTFVVYGSTKSYSLSESFNGFAGGGERPLESLPARLDSLKIWNSNDARDFIYKLYNTAQYTIFEGNRETLTEQGKYLIMSAAATLLFDDWTTIGEESLRTGANCIHVLQLDSLRIPASVFLKAIGQAMIDASDEVDELFSVNLKVLESARPEWAAPGAKIIPDETEKGEHWYTAIYEAWESQAQDGKKESVFTIKFLKNFKDKVKEWVNV